MASSGGHFENFVEAMKLTEPTLVQGYVDDAQKRGNPIDTIPVITGDGTGSQIDMLRKSSDNSTDVKNIGVGGTTLLTEGATFDKETRNLKQCYKYEKLNKFYKSIFKTKNDYEKVTLQSMVNDMLVKLGDKVIYDDTDYGPDTSEEMDGMHALAAVNAGEAWDVDAGEAALSLLKWRKLKDEMRHGVDFWLVPFWLPTYLGAAFGEKGFAGLATATAGTLGTIQWNVNQIGSRIMMFDNVPLIPTDYLVAEQANSGVGSSLRAKYSSGTQMYSMFGVKMRRGGLDKADPGLALCVGTIPADGKEQMISLEYFDKLEGAIAEAWRTSVASCLVDGSKYSICRMFDFTQAAITV